MARCPGILLVLLNVEAKVASVAHVFQVIEVSAASIVTKVRRRQYDLPLCVLRRLSVSLDASAGRRVQAALPNTLTPIAGALPHFGDEILPVLRVLYSVIPGHSTPLILHAMIARSAIPRLRPSGYGKSNSNRMAPMSSDRFLALG